MNRALRKRETTVVYLESGTLGPLFFHLPSIHGKFTVCLALLGMVGGRGGAPGQCSQEGAGGGKEVSQVRICQSNQNPGHCQEPSPAPLQTLMRKETENHS